MLNEQGSRSGACGEASEGATNMIHSRTYWVQPMRRSHEVQPMGRHRRAPALERALGESRRATISNQVGIDRLCWIGKLAPPDSIHEGGTWVRLI